MRFTTQRAHAPTCIHTSIPKTKTRRNSKIGNPEGGDYVRNSPTPRCVLTHTTHVGYDVRGCKRGVYRRSQASTGGSSSADPLAVGEAIDEMLAANDPPKLHKKRKYPEPDFAIERSGAVGGEKSYPIQFKLKAAAFTRVLFVDGQPVGNAGTAKVLGVDRKRIIM